MRLTQNFIRKDFAPLNITASLLVRNPLESPLMQSYDAILNEISPDRKIMPVILLPDLQLVAFDGSMTETTTDDNGNKTQKVVPYSNENLVTDNSDYPLQWIVNGKPIGNVFKEGADFTIDNVGEYDSVDKVNTRGQLKFYRNLTSSERVEIYFDGYVRDRRTGQFIHVKTKPKLLTTLDAGTDEYTLVVNGAHNFSYNPVNDHRLLKEYCQANAYDYTEEDSPTDDVSYLHTWHYELKQGTRTIATDKYQVSVYDKATGALLSADASDGVLAITPTEFTIDTRLRLNREYDIVITMLRKSDNLQIEVARVPVTYRTEYPTINATPLITTGYLPTDIYHSNAIQVNTMSKRKNGDNSPSATRLLYPDLYLDFEWHGVNSLGDDVVLGEGSQITYPISKVNVGDLEPEQIDSKNADNSVASCNYGEYCDGDWKEPLAIATDDDGDYLTNGDAVLAFN